MLTKQALLAELLTKLTASLEAARAAHAAAIEGSTHEEARPENDKDTRALEQSYLARGQAQRVAELEAAVADIAAFAQRELSSHVAIASGALVTVDEAGEPRRFFVLPAGGGTALTGDVQVVTPSSPLGRALVARRVDDEVEVKLPGKTRSFAITAVE